jgi:hypothetical protein
MLLQILNNRKEGLSQFKEKVNYALHWILLGEPDSHIVRKFRMGKHLLKLIKMVLLTPSEVFLINRRTIVISILQLWRIIKFPVTLDLKSIVAPYEGKMNIFGDNDEFSHFKQKLTFCSNIIKPKCVIPEFKFELSLYLSAGPNKGYATGGIFKDIKALYPSDLYPKLKKFNEGVEEFEMFEQFLQDHNKFQLGKRTYIHSRLHLLQDKGGKTRNIAMADQVSQTTFKPLHDAIFKTFKRIKQDGTNDQNAQVCRILSALRLNKTNKLFTLRENFVKFEKYNLFKIDETFYPYGIEEGNSFYSIDMKSCTERFPVEIQRIVLHRLGFLSEERSYL